MHKIQYEELNLTHNMYSGSLTSVMPKGMLPTYRRRACLVIWLPATGTCVGATAKLALEAARRAMLGIWPAATWETC